MRSVILASAVVVAASFPLLSGRPAAAQGLVVMSGGGMYTEPVAYTGPDAISVHIQGNGSLFQESTNGWQPVCLIPCTTTVSPQGNYKLGGLLYKESKPFQFPPAQHLELVAHTASGLDFTGSIWGWTLTSLGVVPIAFGATIFSGVFESGGSATSTDHIVGSVMMAGGVALVVGGIYLLLNAPTTSLTTLDGVRIARAPGQPSAGKVILTPAGLLF